MLKFIFKPFDVLYFGSGKPFNIGGVVSSIFPPFPHTIAGALTQKLIANGIDNKRPIKKIIGPFLHNAKDNKIYFPKPADIYGERKKKDIEKVFMVKPYNNNLNLFKVENTNKPNEIKTFAVYKGKKEVEPFDGFISEDGLKDWINGKEIKKEEIVESKEIFQYETRVGINQEVSTHTVREKDGLYRIDFVRMKENWGFVCWVEFGDSNYEKFFQSEPKVLKFGGEMRNISYEVEEVEEKNNLKNLPPKPKIDDKDFIIKFLYLTPGVYDNFILKISGVEVMGIILSGYMNLGLHSPENLGIYRLMKKAFPAGTVVYARVKNKEDLEKLWLNPSDGSNNFIGSNLIIYGRV